MTLPMGDSYAFMFGEGYRDWIINGAKGSDPLELQDAAFECAHGCLPLDTKIACACWVSWDRAPA